MQDIKKLFSSTLNQCVSDSTKPLEVICRELDVTAKQINSWLAGSNIPRMDKIEKIANYFSLKKSDFVGL